MHNLSRNQQVAVWVSIAVVALFFMSNQLQVVFKQFNQGEISQASAKEGVSSMTTEKENTQLVVQDIVLGTGAVTERGSILTVHYTGTLLDGTKFDSSFDRGSPIQFVLGIGQVIEGWDKGLEGMKVGGKRRLIIPPSLAYGEVSGHPLQNETLVFETELLDVKKP